MEAAKAEINKNVEAKVDFSDFGMSLFSSFPNFSFHLDDITVVGINEFAGDTLAEIASVSAVIDVINVIRGDVYEIKRISILEPRIYLKTHENGSVNWDIAPQGDQAASEEDQNDGPAPIQIALKKFEIISANILYEDVSGNMKVVATNLNHTLSGDFSADKTFMRIHNSIAGLTFVQNGISYIDKANIVFDATIDADLKNEIYTFKKNELKINELKLEFDGSVAMAGGDPNIILTFNAPKNTFRNFLSLIPAIYQKDFKDVQTEGNLTFNGYVKGTYTETALPSFRLDVLVDNAEFKYPGLPGAVKDINLTINIDNPGGIADNTVIDVKQFHFLMINNPFDARLILKNPVTDPFIDAKLNGLINLSDVAKVYPMEENESLSGSVDANITLKGRQSALETKNYNLFEASGSLLLKNIVYSMQDFDAPFEINQAQLNFAPSYIDLVNLDFKYADSDMIMNGKIGNYIPYFLGDEVLNGRFTASSNFFNINQFSGEDAVDTAALSAFKVPANIDFTLDANFKKILYDNIELENLKGQIIVRDEQVTLSSFKGELFNGFMGFTGSYSTKNTNKPLVDFMVDMKKINFQKAFETFGILEKFAPVFQHTIGDFSTDMAFTTSLNEDMNPDWMTFIGKGLMNTSKLKIDNLNTLDKLSEALKIDLFKSADIDPLKAAFDFKEGKLILKPLDFMMEGITANLSGWTAVDETIGYDLKMNVPRKIFGGAANNVLDGLVSQANAKGANFSVGETIPLAVLIGGTLSNPTVKPAIGSAGKGIIEDMKQNALEEIQKQKEELEKQAKAEAQKILNEADAQAQKIIQEAQKQADQIRKTARDVAQRVKTEADAHATKLIAEGKKNGMVAEAAAKKTAEAYKKNAYSEADKAVAEADKQADVVVNTAKQKAAKIKSDAQKRVESL
jgi:cell division septum initiation protein DivIVA